MDSLFVLGNNRIIYRLYHSILCDKISPQKSERIVLGSLLRKVGNGYTDEKVGSIVLKVVYSSVLGGTISEIGGGKFANGAVTGAYSMLFNDLIHDIAQKRMDLARSAERSRDVKAIYKYCNVFAQDKMRKNDMARYSYNLSAGEWGDAGTDIPNWTVVTDGSIQVGDVVAYRPNYSNATGHMGIMIDSQRLVYAGSSVDPKHIVASYLKGWNAN